MPRYVKKIPKTVESALNAFEELSENTYASANERTKNTEILARRITALEKRNKRWAIVMTLLATGAIGVAIWYARATGLPLTANMIVSAKTSMGSMMGSAAATLKSKGRNIVKYFKGNKDVFYGPQKESMTALAQRKAKNFKNAVGKKAVDAGSTIGTMLGRKVASANTNTKFIYPQLANNAYRAQHVWSKTHSTFANEPIISRVSRKLRMK